MGRSAETGGEGMMALMIPPTVRVPLSRGFFATINESDAPSIMRHKWSADVFKKTVYAVRMDGKTKIYMHREIVGFPEGMEVDHWDRNGLMNTRRNLRVSTVAQNRRNCCKRSRFGEATSKYKGVSWDASRGMWKAQIKMDYKGIFIGRYGSEEEAAAAYDFKAKELFGEFALGNSL